VPADPLARAEARAWAAAAEMNFQRPYRQVVLALREPRERWPLGTLREAARAIEESVAALAKRLAGRDHLCGEFSIADIAWGPFVANAREIGLGPLIDAEPLVAAYAERLIARPSMQASKTVQPFWNDIPKDWLGSVT
jgi:glutathione S-transferase